MNLALLLGRVVTDPVLQPLPDGRNVCRFRVATSNGRDRNKQLRKPDFHYIVVWGKNEFDKHPQNIAELLRRGSQVQVTGRITLHTWEPKHSESDGDSGSQEKRSRTEIIASSVEFIFPPKVNSESGSETMSIAEE